MDVLNKKERWILNFFNSRGSSGVMVSVFAFGAGGPWFEPRQGLEVEKTNGDELKEKKMYKTL